MATGNLVFRSTLCGQQNQQLTRRKQVPSELIWTAVHHTVERKVTVLNGGGCDVRWSRDGKELFYVQGGRLMVVAVSTEGVFSAGLPTELFEHARLRTVRNYPYYDVSLDGRRFILAEPVGYDATKAPQATIRVVQNWFAEFKERQQD